MDKCHRRSPTATRDIDAFGTQTAAVFLGGNPEPDHSYEYDGTNWTASNDMGTGRYTSGTAGILTAGLAFGGYSSTANTANTESYNGTSWTEVGNLTVAKRDGASGGIQTAAFLLVEQAHLEVEILKAMHNNCGMELVGLIHPLL